MSEQRSRPGDVILDMLRSRRPRRHRAGALIEAGALFGFTANTMRVTLSRLAARGLIESPQRGVYQLTPQTDALNDFVERWRLGEQRTRPWQSGRWLFAHVPEPSHRCDWALQALGCRTVGPNLQARPDNLALTPAELRSLGEGLGLPRDVVLIAGEPEGDSGPRSWVNAWQPEELDAQYTRNLQRLERSSRLLAELDEAEARLECFTLGGEIIHRLAKDPLLPAPLVNVRDRQALWQAMQEYETLGRKIWAGERGDVPRHMPRPQLPMAV
ncbi:MAG: PaaX family transcriptional regulator C-terminal domain-containing protein [Gammaproteobacteria bacterium]|nr:PaaX family transcriptional regulator C-terminal domain-containing protein [Gammaproteobacteria bacterium]